MRKTLLVLLLLLVAVFMFEQCAFAGAWTVPKDHIWAEWYQKFNWAKYDYNADNKLERKSNDGRSWGWSFEPKIEYGAYDWLNFLMSIVEYKQQYYKEYGRPIAPGNNWGPFRRKNHGVTAVRLGGKIRVIDKPAVISFQTKVDLYTGYGMDHGDDPAFRNQPGIGDGETGIETRALFGKEFHLPFGWKNKQIKCYAGAESGYRVNANSPLVNQVPFFFETGFWLQKQLLIKTELDGRWSHDDTGSVEKEWAIWRIGCLWAVLGGDPVAKQGKQFNVEFQYGLWAWGRNVSADQELIVKIQTEF